MIKELVASMSSALRKWKLSKKLELGGSWHFAENKKHARKASTWYHLTDSLMLSTN